MKPIFVRVAVASALLAVAVSACVVAPAPGYHAVIAWQAPPPGYRWVAHGWHPAGNGWRMEPGHWVRG